MDGVALASVITTGTVSVASTVVAWLNGKRTVAAAIDTRRQTRSAESYLEILRLVESETRYTAQEARKYEDAVEQEEVDEPWLAPPKPARVTEPSTADEALMAAHLAAFGSEKVRGLHAEWREAVSKIKTHMPELDYNLAHYEGHPAPPAEIKHLMEKLVPSMTAAQAALAEGVAQELGHR